MSTASLFPWLVAAALIWAIAWAFYPHFVDFGDDKGDGLGKVALPKPGSAIAYRRRLAAFFAIGGGLSVVMDGLRQYEPVKWYQSHLASLATTLTNRPAEVQGYVSGVAVRITLLWVVTIVSLSLVLRCTMPRRIVVMLHAAVYLLLALVLQAVAISVAITFHIPTQPTAIVATLINVTAGSVVALRLVMTTFQLPRPNLLPIGHRFRLLDTMVMLSFIIVGVALPVIVISIAASPSLNGSLWRRFLPMTGLLLFNLVTTVGLLVLRGRSRKLPAPLANPPQIDVITPAWNEAAGIAMTLGSIDAAAARYGGRVRAIVSNDGSTDDTKRIALEMMQRFHYAEGVFLDHDNTGKAGALNRALAHAESDIVLRLDGDCILHPDALRFAAPWFEDPEVGIVGSRMLPRDDCNGWYGRMRGIETLIGFGCSRLAEQVVDGVGVVPGTYTLFRRQPMIDIGGFTEGMNGEDSDQTCQFGRLGYRVVLDPRVVCYEDVPPTLPEFIEQRTRWARANIHVFARHSVFRNGPVGPRIWFYLMRRAISYGTVPLLVLAPLYFVLALGSVILSASPIYIMAVPTVLGLGLMSLVAAAAVRYRFTKVIPWIPTYLFFAFIRRIALLEGFLSLPTRPVRFARRDPSVPPVRQADLTSPIVYTVKPSRLSWNAT